MIVQGGQSQREAVAGRQARVKTDPASLAQLEGLLGEYESRDLGPLAAVWESKSSRTVASYWC